MADLQYNFLDNNFTTYQPVRETKKPVMKYPLSDIDIELPSGFSSVSSKGTLIADDIIEKDNPKFIVNNTEEHKMNNTEEPNTEFLKSGNNIINFLMNRLKLTREQASGITGVMMSESGLNPKSFNKAEKEGKLKESKANGRGYGAGTLQWSNERKKSALKLIGKENVNIEDLSLEDQLEMVARELEGPYKNTLSGIRKSKTASEAAATMYCHNVGGFSSSNTPATQNEIDNMNKKYSKFTGTDPDKMIVNRGMKFAEQLLQS